MDRTNFVCEHCAEVIGVYEPLFVLCNSHSRLTSRAAEPDLPPDGRYLHRACIELYDRLPASAA